MLDGTTNQAGRDHSAARRGCCMGFRELFALAKGRAWTAEEERAFERLSQEARNQAVRQLASETTCIQTEDRIGTDGCLYTAFWIKTEGR